LDDEVNESPEFSAAAAPSDSGSLLATGSVYNDAVANLVSMGFEREQVVKAMRAAFNNPDRAAEYLLSVRSFKSSTQKELHID
jgi:UV excision repair protein RAD23